MSGYRFQEHLISLPPVGHVISDVSAYVFPVFSQLSIYLLGVLLISFILRALIHT